MELFILVNFFWQKVEMEKAISSLSKFCTQKK